MNFLCAISEPPGPIDNSKICVMKGGHIQLKQGEHQHRWILMCEK